MPKFEDILDEIKDGIADLGKKTAKDFVDEVRQDGDSFLVEIGDDLRRWTDLLARKKISAKEFRVLVEFNRDLAEMKALSAAGLAKKKVQNLANGIVDLVAKTVLKLV
jgi:hypothetical protein